MNITALTRGIFLLNEGLWAPLEQDWETQAGDFEFLFGDAPELNAMVRAYLDKCQAAGMTRVYYSVEAGEVYLAPR